MRDRLARPLVLLVILAATLGGRLLAQADPDAWEARHNRGQPPERIMDALGIAPGMVVGEVGAGRGRFAVHVARRVGAEGLVYANDIDEEALAYLRHRCERDSIANIVTVLGREIEPRLPAGALDVLYVINSYHHFSRPVPLLRSAAAALKPGGLLAIIEHDPKKGASAGHSTPREEVLAEMEEAGYRLERREDFLASDTIYIFRRERQDVADPE